MRENRVRKTIDEHPEATPQQLVNALAEALERSPEITLTSEELEVFVNAQD